MKRRGTRGSDEARDPKLRRWSTRILCVPMAEEANRVRVAVRCRPLNRRELEMKDSTVIDVTSDATLSLRSRGTEEARPFTFDRCFGEDSTQEVSEKGKE